jgi:hypothetical protein
MALYRLLPGLLLIDSLLTPHGSIIESWNLGSFTDYALPPNPIIIVFRFS